MKTDKNGAAPPIVEIIERVRAHVSRPEVAGFTIDYSSGPPEQRVRGSDHRDHARTECLTLAGGLTRWQALDLEADLTALLEHHPKYDKQGVRYTRSAGGGPRVAPEWPVHIVYLAWASVRGRTCHHAENRVLIETIARSGDMGARVYSWIGDDPGYLRALSAPGHFVVAIGKQNVHFHAAQCRFARLARPSATAHPLTGNGRKKYTSVSLEALYGERSKIARQNWRDKSIVGRSVDASERSWPGNKRRGVPL